MGALTVFVPEVIFGLKWKMKRAFTISCCIAWCIFLLKMAHYFFLLWLQMHQLHIMERCALCYLD